MISDEHGLHISQKYHGVHLWNCSNILRLARENFRLPWRFPSMRLTRKSGERLMPVAHKYDLSEVLEACNAYFEKKQDGASPLNIVSYMGERYRRGYSGADIPF